MNLMVFEMGAYIECAAFAKALKKETFEKKRQDVGVFGGCMMDSKDALVS
jgi:hypothetical protein